MANNTVTTVWKENMLFESDNPSGEILFMDAPDEGIENKGLRPKAMMLSSLAGCSGVDIVDILQKELGTSLVCEYIPNPFIGSYQFHTEADITTTKEALEYEPNYEMEDGIKAYVGEIKRVYDEEVK